MSSIGLQLSTELVDFTPSIAAEYLQVNTHNRSKTQSRIDQYKNDMLAGRWAMNGEAIKISDTGVLLDGQHRLQAVADIDVPGFSVQMLVIRGLPMESQMTMDQGGVRHAHQQLSLAGVQADGTMAAAIRLYMRWEQGKLFGDQVRSKTTTAEVVDWALNNDWAVDIGRKFTADGFRKIRCQPSVSMGVALKLYRIDAQAADRFFSKLLNGDSLEVGNPILTLRERLGRIKESKTNEPERDMIAFFVLAWNAWRQSKSMTKFQRPRGGSWTPDNFPHPV
ncbi:hypothetical protein LCL87_20995 [Rhodococcus hoagii]|nr:hypothetical protein [Prescottella equi]